LTSSNKTLHYNNIACKELIHQNTHFNIEHGLIRHVKRIIHALKKNGKVKTWLNHLRV